MEDEIKRQADDPIRLYSFHVPGYVPGIPGAFPAGMQAWINDDTLEVLAKGPLGVPLALPDTSSEETVQEEKPEQAEQEPPASAQDETQPGPGVAEPSSGFNFVEANGKLGG